MIARNNGKTIMLNRQIINKQLGIPIEKLKQQKLLSIIKRLVKETELKYYAIRFVVRKNELVLLRTFDNYIIESWKLTDLEEELLKEWLKDE